MKRWLAGFMAPLLSLLVFAAALAVLYRELQHYTYHDLVQAASDIPSAHIALALVWVVANYLVLATYDILAFRYIRFPLPIRRIIPVSIASFSISNSIGYSVLSGGALRYRYYALFGVCATDIAKVILFCSVTFYLGMASVGSLALVFGLKGAILGPAQGFLPLHALGFALMVLPAGYFAASLLLRRPITIKGVEFGFPNPSIAALQILCASADMLIAGAVFYALLPPEASIPFLRFQCYFIVAIVVGLISAIPGGLGVFEITLMLLLADYVDKKYLFGSFLLFRALYYLLPLFSTALVLVVRETAQKRKALVSYLSLPGRLLPGILPYILSLMGLLGGAVLLFSVVTPGVRGRLAWINQFLPLSAMEASHFLASLAGVALLVLARGIQRRLDAAYHLTLLLLALGSILSILKGGDYEEALILMIFFLLLLPCKRHFFRKAYLGSETFTVRWIILISLVVILAFWLGLFSYKHVEYRKDLWWQFALHGDAPRLLRASIGMSGLLLVVALTRLFKASPILPHTPSPAEMELACQIAGESPDTSAQAVTLGDKAVLFSQNRKSFIMYAPSGRCLISMGDPVGPELESLEVAWAFRELCDVYDYYPVFHSVRQDRLSLYIELGLNITKMGEEARVHLPDFSLAGQRYRHHRSGLRHVEKEGFGFQIIPVDQVPLQLLGLREVSDDWLNRKKTREKRFSLGFFQEAYLSRHPIAVVHKSGKIVAFANLLASAGKEEISVDLMRYSSAAPDGVMDYLFTCIMLHGKAEGFEWFNLGMAPLSGLENHALAPLWHKVGSLIFRHGEHFYNFRGLRAYKQKYGPVWTPRYLVSPGGFALPQVLANLATLISGGWLGVIRK